MEYLILDELSFYKNEIYVLVCFIVLFALGYAFGEEKGIKHERDKIIQHFEDINN